MSNYKVVSDRFLPLTEQLLELSKRLDYVKALWIHGSRSVERHIHTSDIDYHTTHLILNKIFFITKAPNESI